jgi:DNA-binding IscR family transcriptional regulator
MQVSTKFTIAIHLLVAVEYFKDDYKITSSFLASSIGANPVIVRNIMSALTAANLIDVKRGPGGISLKKPLDKISFLDVYKAVEKKEKIFRFHEDPNPQCPVGSHIHEALDGSLEELQNDFEEDLSHKTLDTVYSKIVEANK